MLDKVYIPGSEAELETIVRDASESGTPLEIKGTGSKRSIGRPTQAAATLDMSALSGISLYEPSEMVISAWAGTPLKEVVAVLAEKGQELAFEPMDYGPLLGTDTSNATIGAVAALNISGPRRIFAGAARDSLIGVRFVNGKGDAIKTGGRVMKNVTGYDLVKLMAGANGTLGVLSEVTFKVLPKPESIATLVYAGLDDLTAQELMSEALATPFEVTGAAHVPSQGTFLRLEGFEASLTYRLGEIQDVLSRYGDPKIIVNDEARAQWRDIRDVGPLSATEDDAVWRISTAPTRGPEVAMRIAEELTARRFYDWGGGLVWLAVPAKDDAGAKIIRAALGDNGGHATLVKAPDTVRASAEVYEPLPDRVMDLVRGVKAQFDPKGILNPGRMYAGV